MGFLFWTLPSFLFRICFYLIVFLTPLIGVWLASSLVTFINGPSQLAALSGILLFPLIPILWDLNGRRQGAAAILTWGDRIIFKTLFLNVAFIALLLGLRPQMSFLALSTRGDWFLHGLQGSQVEQVRQGLFKTANGLEWLYLAFHDNPYRAYADARTVVPTAGTGMAQPTTSDSSPQPAPGQGATGWPWNTGVHAAVANMPANAEQTIASVAQYIAQQESDPFLRIKALHDYVATRVAYDVDALEGRVPRPPQDAETVFRTHKAVCAGYAKLLEALGQAIGEEVVYVVGDARGSTSDLSGQGHAWNAAQIAGNWYLIDATWDSGYVNDSVFTPLYQSDYLMPPPETMAISHLPDDEAWQLLPQPLSRGEFLRQPMLRPRFFAEGLQLLSPTRSQTDTTGDAVIQLQNPNQRWLLATYAARGEAQQTPCGTFRSQDPQITCALPGRATYEINLFSSDDQQGQFDYLGQVEFNKR